MAFKDFVLGSHLATIDLYVSDEGQGYEAAKRYYAEIMMPFRTIIQKNLEKVKDYTIDIIAPSHGPMYDKPEFILKAYHRLILQNQILGSRIKEVRNGLQ